MRIQIKTNSFLTFLKKITALLKFMRDTAEKIRGHRMDMTNTTLFCQGQILTLTNKCRICQVQNLTLTDTRFILSAPKYA